MNWLPSPPQIVNKLACRFVGEKGASIDGLFAARVQRDPSTHVDGK